MKLFIKKEDRAKVLNDKKLNAELLSPNCRRITLKFFFAFFFFFFFFCIWILKICFYTLVKTVW
jgi:hypothetical protein